VCIAAKTTMLSVEPTASDDKGPRSFMIGHPDQ